MKQYGFLSDRQWNALPKEVRQAIFASRPLTGPVMKADNRSPEERQRADEQFQRNQELARLSRHMLADLHWMRDQAGCMQPGATAPDSGLLRQVQYERMLAEQNRRIAQGPDGRALEDIFKLAAGFLFGQAVFEAVTITRFAQISELSPAEKALLDSIWRGEQPITALPLTTRQGLAGLYYRVGSETPAGCAQTAFNQARADYLLGLGPNPGPSVTEFARQMDLPMFRR